MWDTNGTQWLFLSFFSSETLAFSVLNSLFNSEIKNGAANGTRTRDPKIHNLVL